MRQLSDYYSALLNKNGRSSALPAKRLRTDFLDRDCNHHIRAGTLIITYSVRACRPLVVQEAHLKRFRLVDDHRRTRQKQDCYGKVFKHQANIELFWAGVKPPPNLVYRIGSRVQDALRSVGRVRVVLMQSNILAINRVNTSDVNVVAGVIGGNS